MIGIDCKRYALATTALVSLVATPAFAQEGSASEPPTQIAAEEADTGPGPGDIIVTARRTEERLQDVPISITVFNQEQLTQRNIAVATDLATYTPSLTVNQRFGPEKSAFNIRGFNQDSNTAPTVGVYFAEVIGVRAQGGTTSGNNVGAGAFTDLQNVQVLKGPQGTLFGRNTTGGAVLLTPRKPTGDFEGYVEGTIGNYDQRKLTAAINVPLAETFKVRAVVERNKRDGFMKNLSGVGPDAYNDLNYKYARLSIVADLTPDLENYTVFTYSDSDTNGYASRVTGCATPTSAQDPLVTRFEGPEFVTPANPGGRNPAFSGTRQLQAESCLLQVARQNARGDSLYETETRNPNPFVKLKQWQVINTTTWRASDTITLKNIASYGEFRERSNFDLGTSNFVVNSTDVGLNSLLALQGVFQPTTGFNLRRISPQLPNLVVPNGTPYQRIVLDTDNPNGGNAQQSSFTNEFQVQGDFDKLNFVAGGYVEFSRPIGFSGGRTGIFLDCTRPQNLACANPLLFGSISESSTKLKFDNHGIFAQGTYEFTEQLSLTAGARYTFDKIVGLTNSTRAGFAANATTGPLFADPLSGRLIARACTDSFRRNRVGPNADPAVVANPPAEDRRVCETRITNKSKEPTYMVSVDYKPTPDMLLYAKYARGYRQGGVNFTNPGVETWEPEQTDNFEVGAKTTFRGAVSGFVNLAAFYNKLNNQQIFAGLTPDPVNAALGVAGGNAVINAGKSRIYGAEVDASVLFFDSLRFDVGYTYLNTKITQSGTAATRGDGSELGEFIRNSPFITIVPTSVLGAPFAYTPKHKLAVTGTYTLPLDESLGELSIGATWVHTSRSVNDYSQPGFVNGIPLGVTPANDLVNLNLDWDRVAGSQFDLSLFATNVTKEKINVASTGAWRSAGVAEILLNQPRFYGVRLRYNFGE